MKQKTKEEYSEAETLTACSFKAAAEMLTNSSCSSPSFALSMNSTGDYKTLFYQGLAISNPNKSKEDWNRKVADMEEKEGLLPQLVQNLYKTLVNGSQCYTKLPLKDKKTR